MTENSRFKRLSSGRDYIADNYLESFSLTDAANNSFMSPFHFSRIFKENYGETPNEFLIRLRIEKAKQMLITENYSVSEICERVGYMSLGSFSSLFLKHVGMPPTSYRRTLWKLSSEPFRYPLQAIPACYAYHFLRKPVN
ncbi:AraC family transcriptional regulator [Marinomonas rhizomae]|uniref:AraC family transcriptional regulator n=1 Tax=Marinomonas rhizomae TaxID=491948 RepID=A0A366IVS1_9GAMM|nr:AraC family transcriptional regulator [Marinomonas rhizomae]RBP77925.1 AraC family transcriptional regulator [Marinomonas rhizomae]RNF68904.1 AraC family transcriptional regulator [Marinomonas rhizomae]